MPTISPFDYTTEQMTPGEFQEFHGHPLTVHVHGWDAWARGGQGGRFVELRYIGAYSGPYKQMASSTAQAFEFASAWRESLGNGPRCECAKCRGEVDDR
jgi:hypothetical protein